MKICLECAEGGHLDEMLCIMDAFKGHELFFVTTKAPTTEKLVENYDVYYVRRQYNTQSKWAIYLRELILMNILIIYSIYILILEHPNVIISTGGGATIPLCYVGKLMNKRIIYIESIARISKPSITGRILYPISDIFLVQWESMLKFYRRAQYWGKVI